MKPKDIRKTSKFQKKFLKIYWWERSPNNTSAMRIMTMIAVLCGALLIVSAITLAILSFLLEEWEALGVVNVLATAGVGIIAAGDFAKSIQAKSETVPPPEKDEEEVELDF